MATKPREQPQQAPGLTVDLLADELVTLARMKATLGPVLTAMRKTIAAWDKEFAATGKRRPLYWPMKKAVGPLAVLNSEIIKSFDAFSADLVTQIGAQAVTEYRAQRRAAARKK
jgi:hypothetical protein